MSTKKAKQATILQDPSPPTVGEMMVIDERNAEIVKISGVGRVGEMQVKFWDTGETRWIPNPHAKPTPPPLPRLRIDDKPIDFDPVATATGGENLDAIIDHDDDDETAPLHAEINRLADALKRMEAQRDEWQGKYTTAERERQRLELDAKRHDEAINRAQKRALELESRGNDADRWKRRAEAAEAKVRLLEATAVKYPGKRTVTLVHPAGEAGDKQLSQYIQQGWAVRFEQFIIGADGKVTHCVRMYKDVKASTPPVSGRMIQTVTPLPTITATEGPRVGSAGHPIAPSFDPDVLNQVAMQRAEIIARQHGSDDHAS